MNRDNNISNNKVSFIEKYNKNIIVSCLIFIILCLPFILYFHILQRDPNSLDFKAYPYPIADFDFYHYYKAVFFMIFVFLGGFIAIFRSKITLSKYTIGLFIFFATVILSSFFSEYRGYTLKGGAKSFQGIFVWIGYGISSMLVFYLFKTRYLKILLFSILLTGSILSFYGLLVMWRVTEVIEFVQFVAPKSFTVNDPNPFIDKGYLVSLFYNPNYYGLYLSMLSTVSACVFLSLNEKKWQYLSFISYILIFSNLIGSRSRAGFYSFVIVSIIFAIILLKRTIIEFSKSNFKSIKIPNYITKSVLLLISSIIVYNMMNAALTNINPVVKNFEKPLQDWAGDSGVKDIRIHGNILEFQSFNYKPIFVKFDNNNVYFSGDLSFKNLLTPSRTQVGDTTVFNNNDYKPYRFYYNNDGFNFRYFKQQPFSFVINNNLPLLRFSGGLVTISNHDKIHYLDKNNRFGSGRGMIWSLSIPLMKETIFLGKGADTFPLLFPNDDYVSKTKALLFGYCAAAHSMYTQLALEFGVFSLIIFLGFIAVYLFETFYIIWNVDFKSFHHFLAIGCALTTLSFIGSSAFYASMLSSSPVFWIVMGIGITSNYKLKKLSLNK